MGIEKKFRMLRIVATIWKVLAWITLVGGALSAIGLLLASILGGGVLPPLLRQFGVNIDQASWGPLAFGAVGGIVMFLVTLIVSIFYFIVMYAAAETIHVALAIEENTRLMGRWVREQGRPAPAAPQQPSPPSSQPRPAAPSRTPPPPTSTPPPKPEP